MVLSMESGTKQDIQQFFDIAYEKYPQYIIKTTLKDLTPPKDVIQKLALTYHYESNLVSQVTKQLSQENEDLGKQRHVAILVDTRPELVAMYHEYERYGFEYQCVHVTPLDSGKFADEYADAIGAMDNSLGLFDREKHEKMKTFVDRCFTM